MRLAGMLITLTLWASSRLVLALPQSYQAIGKNLPQSSAPRDPISDRESLHLRSSYAVSSAAEGIQYTKQHGQLLRRTFSDNRLSRIQAIVEKLRDIDKREVAFDRRNRKTQLQAGQRNRHRANDPQLVQEKAETVLALENELRQLPPMDPKLLQEIDQDPRLKKCLARNLDQALVCPFSFPCFSSSNHLS